MCQTFDQVLCKHDKSHDPAAIFLVDLLLPASTLWSELGNDWSCYTIAGLTTTNKKNKFSQLPQFKKSFYLILRYLCERTGWGIVMEILALHCSDVTVCTCGGESGKP